MRREDESARDKGETTRQDRPRDSDLSDSFSRVPECTTTGDNGAAELQNRAMDTLLQLGATVESATNVVDKIRGSDE